MRVLFLGQPPKTLEPWYGDFRRALNPKHEVILYDRSRPVAEQFAGVQAVVDQGGGIGTHEMMDLAAHHGVKLWQVIGTGLDHTDVPYILGKGLPLANTPGCFSSVALAEHAMFMMLFLCKNYKATQHTLQQRMICTPMNDEVSGKTLLLVGFGASARELANRAVAMDMEVQTVDIVEPPGDVLEAYGVKTFRHVDNLLDLVPDADFISLHTPLTERTHHLISAEIFSAMKPSVFLVNVARGEIIDEQALLEALRENRIAGAGLDVFSQEPIDPAHPLLQFPNVLATPHMAGVTRGTSRRRGEAAAENIERVAQGLPPKFQITQVPGQVAHAH